MHGPHILQGEVNKLQGTVAQLQDANEKLRQNKLASEYYLEQELAAVARDKRYSEMEKDQVCGPGRMHHGRPLAQA